jgi:hypothetical protein
MSFNETDAYKLAESMDMAIVYIYLLKKGTAWTPDSAPETEALLEAHLDELSPPRRYWKGRDKWSTC